MPPRARAAAILWTKSVDSVMCPAMSLASITVRVPTPLRACCGGSAELSVDAADLRDALANLERRYPALYISVCDETGAVRRHVGVFVNSAGSTAATVSFSDLSVQEVTYRPPTRSLRSLCLP